MLQAPLVAPFGVTLKLIMISRTNRGMSLFLDKQETHPVESHTMLAIRVVSDQTGVSTPRLIRC
jgi:hypothetical protein